MPVNDDRNAAEFYDSRYAQGYLEGWSASKQRKVLEVIEMLDLPSEGVALDYGCGNGIFTELVRKALPSWDVYGTDISEVALRNAGNRFRECKFLPFREIGSGHLRADLLFTHHVLEHVRDLDAVLKEMHRIATTDAAMLHILPCGDRGSFEETICRLREDGVDKYRGNRFFYEDPSHLRRLTTQDLTAAMAEHGYRLEKSFYNFRYFGGMKWITEGGAPFIRMLTEPSKGISRGAKSKLQTLQYFLSILAKIRELSTVRVKFRGTDLLNAKGLMNTILKVLFILMKPLFILVDFFIRWLAEYEWKRAKQRQPGSEMYLFFKNGSSYA